MKRILAAIAAVIIYTGAMLTPASTLLHRVNHSWARQTQIILPVDPHSYPQLPPLEVTIAEVIDVFTDYSLHHSDSVGCAQWYGVTDFDRKQIDICDRYDLTFRRITILHEVLHVIFRRHGLDTGGPYEYAIDQKAQALYRQLFVHFDAPPAIPSEVPLAPAP